VQRFAFEDGTVFDRASFLEATLGDAIRFEWNDSNAMSLAGSRFGDTLVGGAGDDAISGGAGDDFLAGQAGNDVIDGGSGDDFLAGNAGNDTLEGGAGSDSFLLGLGMGFDTITDSGGNSTLVLESGTPDAAFSARRDGDDLVFNTRDSIVDGARIAGFYSDPSRWSVKLAGGSTVAATDWLATLSAPAPTPDVQAWADRYRGQVQAYEGGRWAADGYTYGAALRWHRQITSASQSFRSVQNDSRGFSEVIQVSDDPVIGRTNPASTTQYAFSSGSESIVWTANDQTPARFAARGRSSSPYYFDLSGGANGVQFPLDSVLVPVYSGNTRDPFTGAFTPNLTGYYIYPANFDPANAPQVPTTRTVTTSSFDETFVLETITAGESANYIVVGQGYTLAYGGGDDDTIETYDDGRPTNSPGQFYAAGAGADTVAGSRGADVIAGGSGNDTLDGADGGDDYVFFAGDGADRVHDLGQTAGGFQPDGFAAVFSPDSIQTDTIHVPVAFAAVTLSWTDTVASALYYDPQRHGLFFTNEPGQAQSVYAHLQIGYGAGDVITTPIAQADDPAGQGIERFSFADGTVLTRAQLLALA